MHAVALAFSLATLDTYYWLPPLPVCTQRLGKATSAAAEYAFAEPFNRAAFDGAHQTAIFWMFAKRVREYQLEPGYGLIRDMHGDACRRFLGPLRQVPYWWRH
jgi:hypothetical protein